eukprot:CAMPEP_0198133240 /NCGR_PEP_ID=MMETSP1442-20131203/59458_1 /TAXON_ID= /ORGANISM="Craspedostauros australis, Strain CCMP3328" /LENGTH=120 /DNA_ID=CAMNT_0043794353 /DNA_START=657 /DNA_END=1019 /DNA_ORIENTATION=+
MKIILSSLLLAVVAARRTTETTTTPTKPFDPALTRNYWGYPYGWSLQDLPTATTDENKHDEVKEVKNVQTAKPKAKHTVTKSKKTVTPTKEAETPKSRRLPFFPGMSNSLTMDDMMDGFE